MMNNNIPREAQLWGELYALLCQWDSVHFGLASMPEDDKPILDKTAEEIIKEYLTEKPNDSNKPGDSAAHS